MSALDDMWAGPTLVPINGHGDHDLDGHGDHDLWPAPTAPLAVARRLVRHAHQDRNGQRLLHHHRGQFIAWDRCWSPAEDRAVRASVYTVLENAEYLDTTRKEPEAKPWAPTRHKIANVMEALQAAVHLPEVVQPPSWIAGGQGPDPRRLIVAANGILDVVTRELRPLDPRLFSTVAVPFAYDPQTPPPARWLAFLDTIFTDDSDAKAALQEFFGYVLSSRTDLHKILLLVGPTRAGKGVIGRVMKALMGAGNVAGPTLASLGTNFGLQPLIGKPLAIIADARLGRSDANAVTERLLSVSGEDMLTIDRKYLDPWSGTLPTRFMVLTNELPRFGDASGAIAHRFLILSLTESWLGRENHRLTDELLDELPGILNWALDGLQRLARTERFTTPTSSADAVTALQDLTSPVSAFVRDRCQVGAEHEIPVDDLYTAWRHWCEDSGARVSTKAVFGRDLMAAYPLVRQRRHRLADLGGDHRLRIYTGITITAHNDQHPGPSRPGPGGTGWAGQSSIVGRNTDTDSDEPGEVRRGEPRLGPQGRTPVVVPRVRSAVGRPHHRAVPLPLLLHLSSANSSTSTARGSLATHRGSHRRRPRPVAHRSAARTGQPLSTPTSHRRGRGSSPQERRLQPRGKRRCDMTARSGGRGPMRDGLDRDGAPRPTARLTLSPLRGACLAVRGAGCE